MVEEHATSDHEKVGEIMSKAAMIKGIGELWMSQEEYGGSIPGNAEELILLAIREVADSISAIAGSMAVKARREDC